MWLRPIVVKSQRAWSATTENDPLEGKQVASGGLMEGTTGSDFHFRDFFWLPCGVGTEEGRRGIEKFTGSFLNIQARDARSPDQGSGRGAGVESRGI